MLQREGEGVTDLEPRADMNSRDGPRRGHNLNGEGLVQVTKFCYLCVDVMGGRVRGGRGGPQGRRRS